MKYYKYKLREMSEKKNFLSSQLSCDPVRGLDPQVVKHRTKGTP